jgi:hypothetical protein
MIATPSPRVYLLAPITTCGQHSQLVVTMHQPIGIYKQGQSRNNLIVQNLALNLRMRTISPTQTIRVYNQHQE